MWTNWKTDLTPFSLPQYVIWIIYTISMTIVAMAVTRYIGPAASGSGIPVRDGVIIVHSKSKSSQQPFALHTRCTGAESDSWWRGAQALLCARHLCC